MERDRRAFDGGEREGRNLGKGRWSRESASSGKQAPPTAAACRRGAVISEDRGLLDLSKDSHAPKTTCKRQTSDLQESTAAVDAVSASTDHG